MTARSVWASVELAKRLRLTFESMGLYAEGGQAATFVTVATFAGAGGFSAALDCDVAF